MKLIYHANYCIACVTNYYLHQGGYVYIGVSLLVSLFVRKITPKILN